MIERPIPKRAPLLAALRYRDFRLLWFGLLISNLGTWMQFTAMGYFVTQIAGSAHQAALDLGFLGAARAVPVLLLSPIAGVVADTLPRRATLIAANLTMSLTALALAVLATLGRLDMVGLVLISIVNAAAQSFDSPSRQSWVPLLVDRAYVANAIGLNSVAFNAPAVIGPALAGLLIVWVGVAGSFYVNAAATLAVVAAVAVMRPSPPTAARGESLGASIRLGIVFLARHPILRWIILVFVATALLVRPYSQLIPAFAVNVLHADARGLGLAVASAGIGGFGGALVTAYFAQRERRSVLWLISAATMSCGVLALGVVPSLAWSLPVLFLIGIGTLAFLGLSNVLIQTLAPDEVRGRAISVYTMIAIGVVPLGALLDGAIASRIGLHETYLLAGTICVAALLAVWFGRPIIRTV
ncbi:MAG TPA: MFS transporter [Candidatus Tyrphobacter sp.]